MIRKRIEPVLEWLKRVVTQPRSELDRWQATVRFAYELGVHGWRALNRDDAPQMAAALTYRTLFALIPVVVVAAVMIKGLRGEAQFQIMAGDIVRGLGLYEIAIDPRTPTQEESDVKEESVAELGVWIEDMIRQLAEVKLQALGWVSLLLVIYAAIAMMVTVENSFNAIYSAPSGRGWVRRTLIYWFVLTFGPLAIALMMFVNGRFDEWVRSVQAGQWVPTVLSVVWSFSIAWLFMFAMYWMVPNTRVGARPALIGGFVAAVLLEIGRHSLSVYINKAFSFSFLYGSLGLVPVFMFWLYLMWLVVLFGLEVSSTIQTVQGRSWEELEEKHAYRGVVDPASVVNVMELVTERFVAGKPTTTREITEETRIHESTVCNMVDRLVKAGILHRVEGDGGSDAVSLARPPEMVSADRLIEIGFSLADEAGQGRRSHLVQRLRDVQTRLAAQCTLRSMLPPQPSPAASDQV